MSKIYLQQNIDESGRTIKRIFGEQRWINPVRKDKRIPLTPSGKYKLEDCQSNIVYDASITGQQLVLSGGNRSFELDDPKAEAFLWLSGKHPDAKKDSNDNVVCDTWGYIADGSPRQLYKLLLLEEEEQKKIDNSEQEFKYMEKIFSMGEEEINKFGLILGLVGKASVIKMTLKDIIQDQTKNGKEKRENVIRIMDMDGEEKMITVLLMSGLKKGSSDNKTGVHTRATGLYYNEVLLGSDVNSAVAKILNNPDKMDLVKAIKDWVEEGAEKPKTKKKAE